MNTLLNTNCVFDDNGFLYTIINTNQTYTQYAVGKVTKDASINQTSDSLTFLGNTSFTAALSTYHLDMLLPLLFCILGITIGFMLTPANIYISIISSIITTWISVLIVPTIVSTSIAGFITVIALLMLWGAYKYRM